MSRWCEAPRHDADVAAEPGAYVCAECRRRLRRDLLALPGLWRELEDPPTAPGNGGGGTGLDVNERASEHRSQIVHDLVVWAARVAAERPADPACADGVCDGGVACGAVRRRPSRVVHFSGVGAVDGWGVRG